VSDEVYRKVAQDSQKKWRQAHPAYMRQYRREHPEAVVRNRQRQQVRDQKPRLAFLEKNNLASAQLLIFQPLATATAVIPAT